MKKCVKILAPLLLLCLTDGFSALENTNEKSSPPGKEKSEPKKFGFDMFTLTDSDVKDTKVAIKIWLQEIGKKAGYEIESIIYEDYGSIIGSRTTSPWPQSSAVNMPEKIFDRYSNCMWGQWDQGL